MELKQGYKRTGVGVMPEEWECDSIGNLAQITTGSRNTQDRISDGLYPFFVRSQIIERINSFSYDGEAVLTAGDGVGTGKVFHYINGKFDAHQRVYRISNFSNRLSGYFFYLYFSNRFYDRIMQMTAKSSVDSVRRPMIADMLVALPPTRTEQDAIAGAVGDANALIESLERLLAKKRQIKQGMMQELLSGKKRLPGFDGEWEVRALVDLVKFGPRNGYSGRSSEESRGTPTLSLGATTSGALILNAYTVKHLEEIIPPNSDLFLKVGDVLVQRSNTLELVGTTAVFDGPSGVYVYPDLMMRMQFSEDATAHWFWRYANSAAGRRFFVSVAAGSSGSMPKISGEALRKMLIPFPSMPEQTAIATVLSDMEAEIARLEMKLTKVSRIKQGMMQELLTGKIRLVAPKSKIVPFPERNPTAPSSEKTHNPQINEAVLIAILAKGFGSEAFPLGRKRYTKLSYLLHRRFDHRAEGYLKKAAGPYNPATKYKGAEAIAKKNGYIREHKSGAYSGFVAAENIAQAETYFQKWYGEEARQWVEQFHYSKNDELELLATVDMAMEDLRTAGQEVNQAGVRQIIESDPEWKPKLAREIFSDANIARGMERCFQLFS